MREDDLDRGNSAYKDPYLSQKFGSIYPLPELAREDSDLSLKALIKSAVIFKNPVDDPLYSAHQAEMIYSYNRNGTIYLADVSLHMFTKRSSRQ